MSEIYTGEDRRYSGDALDITYSRARCIHAEQCIDHLAAVFDKARRPWIDPNAALVAQAAAVVELCPSGALHYQRKDGVREAVPAQNVIHLRHNGPLEIRGDLAIHGALVRLEQETRASLCRCGSSENKPFCDNSHREIDFQTPEPRLAAVTAAPDASDRLRIHVSVGGPLELRGPVQILTEAGALIYSGDSVDLCRCGGSRNKPFCDGSHERNGFQAE